MKHFITLSFASLLLTGCLSAHDIVKTHYTLTPIDRNLQLPTQHPNTTLQVAAIGAPQWLNSLNIYYQLQYQDTETISFYSRAQWISAPPQLVLRMLENTLSKGTWKAVIGPDSNESADLILHVQLLEFQQIFTAPDKSYGALSARVTLSDNHTNRVIAQTEMDYKVPAPHADVDGGVEALNRAVNKLMASIPQWLAQAVKQNEITMEQGNH
jgi:cholesterol transport system auxiliary component